MSKLGKIVNGASILRDWLGSGGITVSQELAQARSDICNSCPLNTKSSIVTGSVAEAIKEQLEVKKALKLRVNGEKGLGKCSICSCELRLKCWVPIERILPLTPTEFPNYCWITKETLPEPDWTDAP